MDKETKRLSLIMTIAHGVGKNLERRADYVQAILGDCPLVKEMRKDAEQLSVLVGLIDGSVREVEEGG